MISCKIDTGKRKAPERSILLCGNDIRRLPIRINADQTGPSTSLQIETDRFTSTYDFLYYPPTIQGA